MLRSPAFWWALIGLVFVGAELFLPGLVIIFFGIGALFTALLSAILPPVSRSLLLQVLACLAGTGLSFAFLRKHLARVFQGRTITEEGAEIIGKRVLVTERITPEAPGRVRLEGTSWAAASYSESFEPGEAVEILKQEGLTLYVTRSIMEPEPDNCLDSP